MKTPEIQVEKGPLSHGLIEKIATYRRLAFMQNDPSLAVYPSTGELIPQGTPVTQDDLDEIDSGSLPFKNGEQAVVLRGRRRIKEMMELYLGRESARVALINDTRGIIAIALGCMSNFEELYQQEWRYEYPYLDEPSGTEFSYDDLRKRFPEIDMREPTFFFSNIIVDPSFRGHKLSERLHGKLMENLDDVGDFHYMVFDTNNFSRLPLFPRVKGIKRVKDYLNSSEICLVSRNSAMTQYLHENPITS